MTECQGVWLERYMPEDGDPALEVATLKCSDCGEWWVLINHRDAGNFPAELTQEQAFREALTNRMNERMRTP